MKKPPLQDVIVRSRDISRPNMQRPTQRQKYSEQNQERDSFQGNERLERNEHSHYEPEHRGHERMSPPLTRRPMHGRRGGRSMSPTNKKWLLIALGIGAIVVLSSILLSLLFAGATVTVHPKQDSVTVDAIFNADSDGSQGALAVEKTVIERTKVEEVIALGEEEAEERASGKIIIYNEFSETPQRVIKKTRFKTGDGLVFRVDESVEIPGKKSDGTPGSIEVSVRAEEPGEKYNIGPTTFTLPGYEESGLNEHFEKIYAKSVTNMEGGFVGIRRSVGEDERASVLEKLETELRDELIAAAFDGQDTPEGYHLFKEAVFFEFEYLPDVPTDTDKVTLGVTGKLHGILFPEDELEMKLAQLTLSTYTNSPLRIENLDELSVSVTAQDTEESLNPWDATVFRVTAQGKAHFIWEFDENLLANDFAGKNKEILETQNQGGILENHPGIDRLEVSIRPFWKGSFPDSTEDIIVLTELDD